MARIDSARLGVNETWGRVESSTRGRTGPWRLETRDGPVVADGQRQSLKGDLWRCRYTGSVDPETGQPQVTMLHRVLREAGWREVVAQSRAGDTSVLVTLPVPPGKKGNPSSALIDRSHFPGWGQQLDPDPRIRGHLDARVVRVRQGVACGTRTQLDLIPAAPPKGGWSRPGPTVQGNVTTAFHFDPAEVHPEAVFQAVAEHLRGEGRDTVAFDVYDRRALLTAAGQVLHPFWGVFTFDVQELLFAGSFKDGDAWLGLAGPHELRIARPDDLEWATDVAHERGWWPALNATRVEDFVALCEAGAVDLATAPAAALAIRQALGREGLVWFTSWPRAWPDLWVRLHEQVSAGAQ